IGRNQNPVWTLRIVNDAGQLSGCIDPIHGLLVLLHPFAVAVARVGEVDVAAAVEVEIVWAIEFFSVVAVRECDDLSVSFGARDPAPAVRGISLACNQPPLSIELEAVGTAARFTKNAGL